MSETKTPKGQQGAVQTTGHAWDGDLQEFNNPLPRWWIWAFYATVVFAVVYWLFFPAWPVGGSFTKGPLNSITYQKGDETVTTHWNTRARLAKQLQEGDSAVKQREYLAKVSTAGYDEIESDPAKLQFVRALGKQLFADNCAACHGAGGAGVIGLFPNLVDDAWLWGGSHEQINHTLTHGRRGYMPGFAKTFNEEQLAAVTEYVLSLSGQAQDETLVKKGEAIFNGQEGGCYYCHTQAGTGMTAVGSANLTDQIWTVADVPGQSDIAAKRAVIRQVIEDGVVRVMPAWKDRLSESEIKILTSYVYSLGGGTQ